MIMSITSRSRSHARWQLAARLLGHFLSMRAVARQRRQLAQLSDAQLKDIGITRVDAEREAAQPFWRV